MLGDARCAVLLGLSSPTERWTCVRYVWDSRHVTEPSERVGPRPAGRRRRYDTEFENRHQLSMRTNRFGQLETAWWVTTSRMEVPLAAILGQDVADVDFEPADHRAWIRRGAHHALVEDGGGVDLTADQDRVCHAQT